MEVNRCNPQYQLPAEGFLSALNLEWLPQRSWDYSMEKYGKPPGMEFNNDFSFWKWLV
jgi:hypothetical protein